MKEIIKKISEVLKKVFGFGIMLCVFAGGFTFFGYLAAIIIGGETASVICTVIYKQIFPVLIKISTIMVLLGLAIMYLNGEKSLVLNTKRRK